jgi:outer membrane protein TolC
MTPAERQYKDAVESLTNVQEQLDAAVEQMQLLTASYNQAHKRPESFDGDFVAGIQADMAGTSARIQRLRVEVAEADIACARLSRVCSARPVTETQEVAR